MNAIIDRLEAGTLARGDWKGKTNDGRETACLLAAIWPEAGKRMSSANCPAELMPQWIADLTPWIDDEPSAGKWEGFIRRYAALVPWFGTMTQEQSDALSRAFRAACVREALTHSPEGEHVLACEAIAEALEAGREPTLAERNAARAADDAAYAAAAYDAARAVYDAAYDAARAARAAYAAASTAAAAYAAAYAATYAAAAAAADRLAEAFLSKAEEMKEKT